MWKTRCNWFCLVTIGDQATVEMQISFEAGDLTRYLYLHGLSVETAESLAECAHKQAQPPLGIHSTHSARVTEFFTKSTATRVTLLVIQSVRILGVRQRFSNCREPEESVGRVSNRGEPSKAGTEYECDPGASSTGKLLSA